ncbi:MAG: trehalose-phosphatase, partial [Geminicoccaceae bacterium]|nr:trehalose-phosphatase [Geminicoccaceae bacterium]
MPPPPSLDLSTVALFLDVDGTLVEIEKHPDHVHVPDELCDLLARLEVATDGALALVSGRSLEQLDRLFSPLRPCAAGLHGLERRHAGGAVTRAAPDPAAYGEARGVLERLVRDDRRLLHRQLDIRPRLPADRPAPASNLRPVFVGIIDRLAKDGLLPSRAAA